MAEKRITPDKYTVAGTSGGELIRSYTNAATGVSVYLIEACHHEEDDYPTRFVRVIDGDKIADGTKGLSPAIEKAFKGASARVAKGFRMP